MKQQNGYPYIIQGTNIILCVDNKTWTISKTHVNYNTILDCIKNDVWDNIKSLLDVAQTITKFSQGHIQVQDGVILWKGSPFHNTLSTRILKMIEEGFEIKPMLNFMENLMQNPSARSVNELYGFLEKSSLPITPDGHFLAFKRVKDNYKDVYTGTIDNSVGQIVKMERNQVNDDRDQTCSQGLHFCSKDYLEYFGGERIMILKINPRDVVSIPSDYNDAKGRCCLYEVVGELQEDQKPETVFDGSVDDSWYYQDEDTNSWGHEMEFYVDDTVQNSQPRDSKGRFLPKNK